MGILLLGLELGQPPRVHHAANFLQGWGCSVPNGFFTIGLANFRSQIRHATALFQGWIQDLNHQVILFAGTHKAVGVLVANQKTAWGNK
jgi:hypothetical protein